MKNLAKLLVMALLVGLFGVVAVSSLLATPSVQTPLVATTSYNVETGIRWNEGLGVFEVFNATGFSYIAAEEGFNAAGELYDNALHGSTGGFRATDGHQRYHIMQDIIFDDSTVGYAAFMAGVRYSIENTGLVDGRGFKIEGLPIANGSAMFYRNAGTIRNIELVNPKYKSGALSNETIGLIAKENRNTGIIENCEVRGADITISDEVSIAAIAYSSSGTIRNCVNYLNIITNGQCSAGIAVDASNSSLVSNRNFGSIKSNAADSFAGGIAATVTFGEALDNANYGRITANDAGGILGTCTGTMVKGNKNLGNITGINTACGMVGGIVVSINESGNSNNGDLSSLRTDPIYLSQVDENGIFYVPSVGMGSGVFMITNMIGLSYIGSDVYFDNAGQIVSENAPKSAKASSDNTTYIITKDINYSVIAGRDKPLVIGEGSVVDGQGHELRNFPIRLTNTASEYSALFESIASGAEVRNLNLNVSGVFPDGASTGNIGVFSYQNNGTIKNSVLAGDDLITTNAFNVGGFAYTASAIHATKFEGCTNKLNITSSGSTMGGIMATTNETTTSISTFTDCMNKGNITSQDYTGTVEVTIGGIAGNVIYPDVKQCVNEGNISNLRNNIMRAISIGGLFGNAEFGTVYQGINHGEVTVKNAVQTGILAMGGITGVSLYMSYVDLLGGESSLIYTDGVTASNNAGGLLGWVTTGTVEEVSFFSDWLGTTILSRGNTVVFNARFLGDISIDIQPLNSIAYLGGVVGVFYTTNEGGISFSNVVSSGNISVEFSDGERLRSKIGGLIGEVRIVGVGPVTSYVENCENNIELNVPSIYAAVGGIIGEIQGTGATLVVSGLINNKNVSSIPYEGSGTQNTKTGTFAGLAPVNLYVDVTVDGAGVASSGRIIGNYEP